MSLRLTLFVVVLLTATASGNVDQFTSDWVRQLYSKNYQTTTTEVNLSPSLDSEDNKEYCITREKDIGECVPYYLCDSVTKTVVTDGSYLLDARNRECSSNLEVCCTFENVREPTTTAAAIEVKMLSNSAHNDTDDGLYDDQCGWNDESMFISEKSKSFNESYANFGEFPWMVAVMRDSGTSVWTKNDFLGGGTLIHPSVVMTVAHKLKGLIPEKMKCRAGEWDTQTTDESTYSFMEKKVKNFKIHSEYFRRSLYNDVALLFLEEPFDLSSLPHISVACLGRTLPDPGTECYSMGWGSNFLADDWENVNILKKVKLPLVRVKDCEEKLRKTRLGKFYRVHKSLTCAGGKVDVDTCQGDGGSALVCKINERSKHTRYAVYGIVAFGLDCGESDIPGLYVNVPNVVNWIDNEMTKTNYGTVTYTDSS